MKVIKNGTTYQLYDSSIEVYDELPIATYKVHYDKNSGWSLIEVDDIQDFKDRVYGPLEKKVDKVLNTFKTFDGNLGILLSGDKGTGKTLFARKLANKMLENYVPVILVNEYIKGIAGFLASIDQTVAVLFDEFDKTFSMGDDVTSIDNPQTEMLTLFDGVYSGNKLFIVTCNDIYELSSYFLNRPGRFHYHLRFRYPTDSEIEVYLRDHDMSDDVIKSVLTFSRKVKLNYDCLSAIVKEMTISKSFSEAVDDLNIVNSQDSRYKVCYYNYSNNLIATTKEIIDMFSDEAYFITTPSQFGCISIGIRSTKAKYDLSKKAYIVCKEDLVTEDNNEYLKDVSYISIEPCEDYDSLHYDLHNL